MQVISVQENLQEQGEDAYCVSGSRGRDQDPAQKRDACSTVYSNVDRFGSLPGRCGLYHKITCNKSYVAPEHAQSKE